MNHSENKSSSSTNGDAQQVESGWTTYLEDFSLMNNNQRENYDDEDNFGPNYSLTSYDSSNIAPWNNNINYCNTNYNQDELSPKKLNLKKLPRNKKINDPDLEDTASSPVNSPKGGPSWNVPTGRRDGRISNTSEALADIPAPTSNFTTLQSSFTKKGLDLKDLVVLSGVHTIGISHCPSFSSRLHNFTRTFGTQDPSLDSEYTANLKAKKCKSLNDNTTIVEMDSGSFRTFDLSYYKLLLKRRGLFQSDAALLTSSRTKSFIDKLVQGSLNEFYVEFAKAMEKMGKIEVKTGSNGEIRKKKCAVVNN